ncbi:MAG: hypothetical protein ACP5UH_00730 [Candidatus Micrarchaeia archaeon]
MENRVPRASAKKGISAIKDYATSLLESIGDPTVAAGINDKISKFFNLINEADLQSLNRSELLQLNNILISFHNALDKNSSKANTAIFKAQSIATISNGAEATSYKSELPKTNSTAVKAAEEDNEKRSLMPFTLKSKKSFIDREGVERSVYELQLSAGAEISLVLYPKNAMPFGEDLVKGREVVLFGGEPKSRDIEVWSKSVEDLKKNSINFKNEAMNLLAPNQKTTVFVEIDPIQIARLAKSLGSKNELVDEVIKWGDSKDWRIGQKVYSVIDSLIAGTMIDDKGELSARRDANGAYLVLEWLLGDAQAEKALQNKVDRLTDIINEWKENYTIYSKYIDLARAGLLLAGTNSRCEVWAHNSKTALSSYLKELDIDAAEISTDTLPNIKAKLESLQKKYAEESILLQGAQEKLHKAGNSREIFEINKKLVQIEDATRYLTALNTFWSWEEKVEHLPPKSSESFKDAVKKLVSEDRAIKDLIEAIRVADPSIASMPKLGELIAVHITQFYPSKGLDGSRVIVPTVDATLFDIPRDVIITSAYLQDFLNRFGNKKPVLPRNTIHFALNDAASGGGELFVGDWQRMPFAIIAPLSSLIKSNGKPYSVPSNDTFFRVSPGEGLKLPPDAIIVRPMTDKEKQESSDLFVQKGDTIVYNPEKIKSGEVVRAVLKSKGYKIIPYDVGGAAQNYNDPRWFSDLLHALELGVTDQPDSALMNHMFITKFKDDLRALQLGRISMAKFEEQRDKELEIIFSISNDLLSSLDVSNDIGYASWSEFRTLFLSGVL